MTDLWRTLDPLVDALLAAARALPFEWAQFDFMCRALVALLMLGPACAMAGVYVVNFRMAFFSDAIAHSAFAGVATGFLLLAAGQQWADPRLTLLVVALIVGIAITLVKRKTDLGTDTVIGVAFSAVIALGIVIITRSPRFTGDFNAFLYGDILLLDRDDLRVSVLLAAVVILFMLWSYNRLLLIAINHDLARSRRTRTRVYDYLFATIVVLLVTAGIRITGILLVTALLVVPAATARLLARSAGQMFWIASAAALVSAVLGLLASYYIETATGAAVVLVGTLLFVASLAVRLIQRR
ncbi:MAG: metal ABC transporter permease [Planctomycetes bacterium]|nr:metal ABC transporter permease [Planctomycetota bacterium]